MIRHIGDSRAIETAREQAGQHEVALLLLNDAVLDPPPFDGTIYACLADVEARPVRKSYETLDYPDIIKLIFEYDRVISW
ncbi:MAG: hypothetical protein Q7O66_03490 [Dehalococcoidia bacterium]|nr:hypothetical protein [Dehalococcoidia bacterium]